MLRDPVKDRENERGRRETQPHFRLFPLSGVGNSEAPPMERYVLPLRGPWESRCYDKFRVKMRIERKGRKAKGQNRLISPLFRLFCDRLFCDLLKFEFSVGRAPGRPRAGGKSSVSRVYLPSVSLWRFFPSPLLHADVGRPGWRDSVSEHLRRRSWSPMHL